MKLLRSLLAASLLAGVLPAPQAHAVSKEMIQLQTQVQQLEDMLQRLQSTTDSRFGVLQHLVEQTADSVNQMNQTVSGLERKLSQQTDSSAGKIDGLSGQIQALNDSVDELKTRLGKVDQQLQAIQSQMQNVQSPSGAGTTGSGTTGPGSPGAGAASGPGPASSAAQAPPIQTLYQAGLRDYNSARYEVAASEFGDVLKYYPHEDLAGNAQFYLAEIAYRQQKYRDAIRGYDAVLEQFAGNPKAPAAQLRKGDALVELNDKDAGIREFRSLIQRYPQTPEAAQARSRLNGMGVRIAPKPTAARTQ